MEYTSFASLSPAQLLRPEGFDCACGAHHGSRIKFLRVGPGVLADLPKALEALGVSRPLVVTDANCYAAAGAKVVSILEANHIPHTLHIIPGREGENIAPNEFSVGSILLHFDPQCDLIMGVGSGVINDLTKVVATACRRPSMIVGTAPSMDGFASENASMEVNNVKLTLSEHAPEAILCDTDILSQAPMRMLWAGLGDMLAKHTALCEWQIARIVVDESYCPEVAQLMANSLSIIMEGAPRVARRDPGTIGAITNGLVLSGLAMAFAGISRPASGLEHYFSHAWEMMALARGNAPDLHGIQVGVGTLLSLKLMHRLAAVQPTMERVEAAIAAFDPAAWEANIRRVFGPTAEDVLAIERTAHKNDPDARRLRARRIIGHWDEIAAFLKQLPSAEEIEALMVAVGMPTRPQHIGLTAQDGVDAFVCSRDIRTKYLTSSLIWDLGYMDEFAAWLADFLNA